MTDYISVTSRLN